MLEDKQLEKPICYCDFCGAEVYSGDLIYRIEGEIIHEECLSDYAEERFRPCREIIH